MVLPIKTCASVRTWRPSLSGRLSEVRGLKFKKDSTCARIVANSSIVSLDSPMLIFKWVLVDFTAVSKDQQNEANALE